MLLNLPPNNDTFLYFNVLISDPFNSVPSNVKLKKITPIRANIKKAMIYKQAKQLPPCWEN